MSAGHVCGESQAMAMLAAELRAERDKLAATVQQDDVARAMYSAAMTVKATGGAVEIDGVRIEACDTYGRTTSSAVPDRDAIACAIEESIPDDVAGWRFRYSERGADAVLAIIPGRTEAFVREQIARDIEAVREAKAEAWDQGFDTATRNATADAEHQASKVANPYRQDGRIARGERP